MPESQSDTMNAADAGQHMSTERKPAKQDVPDSKIPMPQNAVSCGGHLHQSRPHQGTSGETVML
jgi:hypothetical protein